MSSHTPPIEFAARFGSGHSVQRIEDEGLLKGLDDIGHIRVPHVVDRCPDADDDEIQAA